MAVTNSIDGSPTIDRSPTSPHRNTYQELGSQELQEQLYKVLVIGDFAVGK